MVGIQPLIGNLIGEDGLAVRFLLDHAAHGKTSLQLPSKQMVYVILSFNHAACKEQVVEALEIVIVSILTFQQ